MPFSERRTSRRARSYEEICMDEISGFIKDMTFKVPVEWHRWFKTRCAELGKSMTAVLYEAVEAYMIAKFGPVKGRAPKR